MTSNEVREATEAEKAQMKRQAATNAELRAMDVAFGALHKLGETSRRRAMRWLDAALFNHGDEEPPF